MLEPRADGLLRCLEVVARLQVEPELRRDAEKAPQTQGSVGSDRPLPFENGADAGFGHVGIFGKPVGADAVLV